MIGLEEKNVFVQSCSFIFSERKSFAKISVLLLKVA